MCHHFLLSKGEWYSTVWIDQTLFIHSFFKGCLGCFLLLVIMNSAAMNISVQISVQNLAFSLPGCISRSGMVDHRAVSLFNFFEEPPYDFP